jgi:DNA primase
VTLLHQHQREHKTATINGHAIAYIETTIGDIQVAHRLAHAVLGQSLDELAPQTRRLLTAVDGYVTSEAQRLAVGRDLVRFTRRQLREHLATGGTGWGDTQLKVHLARLVDLELLIAHRLETGAFGYELTWNPPATSDTDGTGRFLAGLTDPAALLDGHSTTYDPESVGATPLVVGLRSGPGRGPVGPRSQPSHDLGWAAGDG